MSSDKVKRVPPQIGWYLAGFADGEGSFNVSFRPRDDYSLPWKVSLCFNVSQRDPVVLSLYKRHLGCGTMRQREDGCWYFEVNTFEAITSSVIPFFVRFGFLSAKKKRDFAKFVKLAAMMKQGRHLTRDGIVEILEVRRDMNDGGKRRYDDDEIMRRFENPQRLNARPSRERRMLQSDLHGNMQSAAEMPVPEDAGARKSSESSRNSNERS